MTHRYYDAPTGRFLNRDPIGYSGGENLYAFCGNNPINYCDSEGTSGSGSWWQRFCRWFMGSYHVKPMGGDRGNEGMEGDEASAIGEPQLIQHPAAATRKFRAGAIAAVVAMGAAVAVAPVGTEGEGLAGTSEEFALGLSNGLGAFRKVAPSAKNYADLGLTGSEANFPQEILAAMNGAKKLHFNLTGMRCLTGPQGVLTAGPEFINPAGSTNWELRTIWDNPALKAKTTFYLNGKVISAAKILKLP